MKIFRFFKKIYRRMLIITKAMNFLYIEYEYVSSLRYNLVKERNCTETAFNELKFDLNMVSTSRTLEEYESRKSIALRKFNLIVCTHNYPWCRMQNTIELRRYYLTLKPLKCYKNWCHRTKKLLNQIEEYRQDQIYFRKPSTIEYELKKSLAKFKKHQASIDFDMERT